MVRACRTPKQDRSVRGRLVGEDVEYRGVVDDLLDRFSRTLTVLDGGLATELEARGHDLSGKLWSARLLAEEPEAIAGVHRAFFEAGAQVATTASYQASFEGFADVGYDRATALRLLRRSVTLAQNVRDEVRPQDGLVAASIGPFGAVLADGSEYRGDYGLTVDELRAFHQPRLETLAMTGADLFALETIPCLAEVEALCAELDGNGHPAWLSLTTRGGRTAAGESLTEAFAMAAEVEEIVALGVNCCAPADVAVALVAAREVTTKPLLAYPHTGQSWNAATREWEGTSTFHLPLVGQWRRSGAKLFGGCCRVTPADIAQLAGALAEVTPRWAPRWARPSAEPG